MSRVAPLALALAVGLLAPPPARAQPEEVTAERPAEDAAPRWDPSWRQISWPDYVTVGGLTAANLLVEFAGWKRIASSGWHGGLPGEDRVADALGLPTRAEREAADRWSDVFWFGSELYPVIVDAGLLALLVHGDPELAADLAMVQLEAVGVSALLAQLFHRLVGRDRPLTVGCEADSEYDALCGTTARFHSFPSGHSMLAFTGAGLTCALAPQLRLYGSRDAGWAACGAVIAMATTNATLRLLAERHYLSDVLVGAALGFAVGYGLPQLLVFHWPGGGPAPSRRAVVVPLTEPDALGLALGGTF